MYAGLARSEKLGGRGKVSSACSCFLPRSRTVASAGSLILYGHNCFPEGLKDELVAFQSSFLISRNLTSS